MPPMLLEAAPPVAPGALFWVVSLLGAGTAGAFAMKVLDVFLFDRWAKKKEFRNWIRQERLRAFSALARQLFTLGFGDGRDALEAVDIGWEILGVTAEASLLTSDARLIAMFHEMDQIWHQIVAARLAGGKGHAELKEYSAVMNAVLEQCREQIMKDRT